MKPGLARRRREAIPWADVLADVTAEDPVAHERTQLARDGAAQLDREVGDAAPRVHAIRCDDGPRGTRIEAAVAAAAMLALERQVGLERAVHQQLAQQEPGADRLRDQAGVLADPAQAGALGPAALQDRAGVGIAQHVRPRQLVAHEALECAQVIAHHAVVILAHGVSGDAPQAPVERGIGARRVAHRHAHDGLNAGQHLLWIGAPLAVARAYEVGHLAVVPGGQPDFEVLARFEGPDARHARCLEPDLSRSLLDPRGRLRWTGRIRG